MKWARAFIQRIGNHLQDMFVVFVQLFALCYIYILHSRPHFVGPIEFEDADLSTLPQQASTPDAEKKDFVGQDRSKKEGGGKQFEIDYSE